FALAPSRVMGNLDVRLMWALAWPAPKDQQRGARADRANEPREFLMGRATDPWRAAEAWIRCLASHCVPIHATTDLFSLPELAELPAEPGAWIGAISLGEAGRISDQLLDLVRSWIAGVVGGVTKVRDSFRRGLIEPSLTLHRLRPYQSFSNRTAQRDPRSGCMPIPRPPTILSRGDNWTMAARRLSLGSVRFIWM